MASNAILAAAGLVTSPNQLDTQEGSLSEASNVIIKRDGIIEQRRGFSVYGDPFPSVVNRAKQITSYRERIIRHYGSRLQFDSNAIGRFLDVEGQVVETEQGLRLKFIESNGNLYFTTRDGVKKLSAANSSDLALMTVEDSGIEKALDIKAFPKIVDNLQSGFLPQDSTVAYRVVWNKEDRNKNLITGAPSQRAIVTFPMGELIVRDTMRLLEALDDLSNLSPSTARIDDGNYLQLLKLQLTSSPSEIRTKLIALADKLDNDIILAKRTVGIPAPVRIDSAEIEGGIATIKFEKVEAVDLDALNALLPEQKQTYIIYKTTSDSKLYQWNGSAFVEREVLKDYFINGLDVRLSGFSLTTRAEKQQITFSVAPTSGNLTLRYRNSESGPIPAGSPVDTIKIEISKVPGLELIETVEGEWNTDGFILTFSSVAGDLDQITVGSATTLQGATGPVLVTTKTLPKSDGISATRGELDGVQRIAVVSEDTITFNTQAIGVVVVGPDAEIKYNEFRSIPEPLEPSSPALNQELESLQVYLDTILEILQNIPSSIVSEYPVQEYDSLGDFPPTGAQEILYKAKDTEKTYIWDNFTYVEGTDDKTKLDVISLTTSANVELMFTIPKTITTDYFYQIYRSSISQAVGASILEDLSPNDEMRLIFEAYPTEEDLERGIITALDETPDIFRGANLYTNAATGEGALQSNDQPPFAKDINRYRNSIFYANTRTKHRLELGLLPVENLIQSYDEDNKPKLTITDGQITNTYTFVTGKNEVVKITVNDTNVVGKSFNLFSTRGVKYRVYFNTTTDLEQDEIPVKIEIGEESRTNLLQRSEEFENAYWTKTRSSISANSTIAPNGALTADKLVEDTITGTHLVQRSTTVSTGTTYTYSVFVKAAERTIVRLNTDDTRFGAGSHATYNLLTKQITLGNSSTVVATMSELSNGWFRLSYTMTAVATGTDTFQIMLQNSPTVTSYLGDGTSGVFIWGAQLEVGSYPTSYIPTTTAPVTRPGELTTQQIAKEISNKISTLLDDFSTIHEEGVNIVEIVNITSGEVNDPLPRDIGSSLSFEIEQGRGANPEDLEVLLSTKISIAQAVDETAKSLIEIINKNKDESVYAFYLSGADDVPGKILLESRSLQSLESFYVSTGSVILGESFNPDISPDTLINNIKVISGKTTVTTETPHGLLTGDSVVISGTNSTPSIDGIEVVTRISDTEFTIEVEIETSGDTGAIIEKSIAFSSDNELKPNRVYYSKFNQPEAVPFINYFDLGASDKQIIRILPLRDSLFVFKEDGLFRISGETAPFQSELFDNSFILLAPDSLDVCNNVIYGWTTQGVQALTEGGATVISRNIDNIILKTQSNNYVNFKKATWGIGYESDNSYIIFTVKNTEDEFAEIAYRYSTITNTWTTYDKSFSCGHIADFDDHFYAGATDIASIEKERKTFSRLDYADREYESTIGAGRIQRNKIILPTVTNFEVGDVLVQDQTVSIYEFNQLLNKLDADSGPSFNDYFEKFKMSVGSFPKNSLVSLCTYLDSDTNIEKTDYESSINSKSGTITFIELEKEAIITSTSHGLLTGRVIQITGSDSVPSIDGRHVVTIIDNDTFKIPLSVIRNGSTGSWQTLDGDFDDLKTCYNHIITKLNIDKGTNFNNYRRIDNNTIQETIITAIDRVKREVTTNLTLPFLAGEITIFKAIKSSIAYSPNTFGDPLSLKHLREATLMFETRTLTSGILSFATDLLPQFIKIPFNLDGNGIFGHQTFGENFFGGLSNSAPFRTYVPRQCQRCRYIVVKFSHAIAREDWRLLGTTMTGEVQQSTRAFR
jgi:hypothetical protein